MIKLIITDIEGVLTPPEGSQMPWALKTLLKIRQFIQEQKSRITCVLCSGRSSLYGEALIQALNLFFPYPQEKIKNFINIWEKPLISWPSIFENGLIFYDPLAKRFFLNSELNKVHITMIQEIREKVIPRLLRDTDCQLETGKFSSISLNPPFKKNSHKERISTDEFRPKVESALKGYFDYIEISHSESAIDIVPKGISKASAVHFLIKNSGVKTSEVLGVGDTAADKEWLNIVGWSATPANGKGKLTQMNYFSPYEVEEGFFDILKNLKVHNFEKVGQ